MQHDRESRQVRMSADGSEAAKADILLLPAPSGDSSTTNLDTPKQSTMKLEHLGPLVVNSDGTLSRIQNWVGMTEDERGRTLRILGKRNMLRREQLTEAEGDQTT